MNCWNANLTNRLTFALLLCIINTQIKRTERKK
nr:MAG TPA: hypothetical protein [Caudoviricetes sp.]